jgi:WD40 repeat protein
MALKPQTRPIRVGGGVVERLRTEPPWLLIGMVVLAAMALAFQILARQQAYPLPRMAGAITAMAFSPDGRGLAIASDDGELAVFDLTRGAQRIRLDRPGPISELVYGPKGALAYLTQRDVLGLEQAATGRPETLPSILMHDASRLRLVSAQDGSIWVAGQSLEHQSWVTSLGVDETEPVHMLDSGRAPTLLFALAASKTKPPASLSSRPLAVLRVNVDGGVVLSDFVQPAPYKSYSVGESILLADLLGLKSSSSQLLHDASRYSTDFYPDRLPKAFVTDDGRYIYTIVDGRLYGPNQERLEGGPFISTDLHSTSDPLAAMTDNISADPSGDSRETDFNLTITADGRYAMAATLKEIYKWKLADDSAVKISLAKAPAGTGLVAFSRDGKRIARLLTDGSIAEFDLDADGAELSRVQTTGGVTDLCYGNENRLKTTGCPPRQPRTLGRRRSIVLAQSGSWTVTRRPGGLIADRQGQSLSVEADPSAPLELAISADGARIVYVFHEGDELGRVVNVCLACLDSKVLAAMTTDPADPSRGWLVNARGLVLSFDNTAQSKPVKADMNAARGMTGLTAARFVRTPDGLRLVQGRSDGVALLVDPQAGRVIGRFAGHHGPITAIRATPDGRRAAIGAADGSIEIVSLLDRGLLLARLEQSWGKLWDSLKLPTHSLSGQP